MQKYRGVFCAGDAGGGRPLLGRSAHLSPPGWATGGQSPVDRGPVARATGDPPPLFKRPPSKPSFAAKKIQKKRRGVRRSEAAKPCWFLDLRSAGNCLSLIINPDRYRIKFGLQRYALLLLNM